ncbi:MAG: hypothetical protein ACK5MJ_07215 [Alphaproteobacteria bacterium]
MITNENNFTLYWDPNFVSSQQLWLLMIYAKIDAKLVSSSIFSGEILKKQDEDLPSGLWLPILRDEQKASEGLMRCFNRLIDNENITALRGPTWLDGRAYNLCKKAILCEDHLLLIEGEFLYQSHLRNIRKQAPFFQQGIQDNIKAELIFNIISGRISPNALRISLEYIHKQLTDLNEHLGYQLTLNADEFGLADILWLPVIRRLIYMDWPLKNYSELMAWYQEACHHFSAISRLDNLERLPSRSEYGLWQKINWLGGRNLKSSLKLMGLDTK